MNKVGPHQLIRMEFKFNKRKELESNVLIEDKHIARFISTEHVGVLATPYMIGFMENTTRLLLEEQLPEGYTSVGTDVCVKHLAAAPRGANLRVYAKILDHEDRNVTFAVEATWGDKKVGEGTHTRFIVNKERFLSRLKVLSEESSQRM